MARFSVVKYVVYSQGPPEPLEKRSKDKLRGSGLM